MGHRLPTEPSGNFVERLVGLMRLHLISAFRGEEEKKIQLCFQPLWLSHRAGEH